MLFNIRWYLQYLADGDGGEGGEAATGETATGAADLSSKLAEMGVPQERLAKRKKQLDAKSAGYKQTEKKAEEETPAAQEESAKVEEKAEEPDPPKRLTWDEIMADPEYNKSMQDTVNKRLKASKSAQENFNKLAPLMEVLGGYYGMDTSDMSKLDIDGLVQKVIDDNTYYEDRSVAEGKSVEEIKKEAAKARADRDLIEQNRRQRFMEARQQGEALKQVIPDFDFGVELQNPKFTAMVMNYGMSVEDAYHAIHHAEREKAIKEQAAKTAAENAARSIQAGQQRPAENGSTPQAASVSTVNYKDPQYRAALKQQIYAAAARGQKIYPTR